MTPQRFRKRPVVIEAMKWDGTAEGAAAIRKWGAPLELHWGPVQRELGYAQRRVLMVETLEGFIVASSGDWIIKGVAGEFYPCKPDIFEATYEFMGEPPPPAKPAQPDRIRKWL